MKKKTKQNKSVRKNHGMTANAKKTLKNPLNQLYISTNNVS